MTDIIRITVGGLSLLIERVGPNAVQVGAGLLSVTLSKAEIFELRHDLEQVLAELFPDGEES